MRPVDAPAPPSAVEFFSGIGAFAAAARATGTARVIAAFDQSEPAGRVYEANFGAVPSRRNLDTIRPDEIPDADLWWMSPPCTPYTVRGARRDAADPRAASLATLLRALAVRRPRALLLENVPGFAGSQMHARLLGVLADAGYGVAERELDPVAFGVPMNRRRFFLAATLDGPPDPAFPSPGPLAPLRSFLDPAPAPELDVDPAEAERYAPALHVVDPEDPGAIAACTTRGYARGILFGGSLVRRPDRGLRRLSPPELLRLFGFPAGYRFPEDLPAPVRWKLLGNSLDVRAAAFLLRAVAARLAGAAVAA